MSPIGPGVDHLLTYQPATIGPGDAGDQFRQRGDGRSPGPIGPGLRLCRRRQRQYVTVRVLVTDTSVTTAALMKPPTYGFPVTR
ncbi:hypothetical protein ABID92_001870 [Frigoribacterium sp. PvP120]